MPLKLAPQAKVLAQLTKTKWHVAPCVCTTYFTQNGLLKKLKEVMDYHNFVLTNYLGQKAVDFNQQYDASMQHAIALKADD